MDDLATRFADLLEGIATKIRSLTVDRVLRITNWAALGLVAATLGLVAVVLLTIGLFRLVGQWLGVTPAYAAFGGLFVVVGAFLWSRGTRGSR